MTVSPAPIVLTLVLALAACADAPDDPPAEAPRAAVSAPSATSDSLGGMAFIPGGTTTIGSDDGLPHERPRFRANVAPFFLDRSPVTVGRFRQFAEATAFVTQAERFGDAAVLDEGRGWHLVPGADWRRPHGPGAAAAPDDHPVTQVSWDDAAAFCAWAGGRLPTEVEWEHAARGAIDDPSPYAWGDRLADTDASGHRHVHANTWEGEFPVHDTGADGFRGTSPVGHFGANRLGLTDLGGNVWEWTADWYRSYDDRDRPFTPTAQSERSQRGGSYLCNASYCHGYRVSARSHSTPETSAAHVGFRCARDASGDEFAVSEI